MREKISSPSAGLHERNLHVCECGTRLRVRQSRKAARDSVAGAHPVRCLECLAGFFHPRNPKISRTQPALIASGKEIFSLEAESPKLRRRRAVAKPIGKMGEQARRVRTTQTVVYHDPAVGKQTVYFLFQKMQLENQTSLFSLSAETSVGRTSAEGGDPALYD